MGLDMYIDDVHGMDENGEYNSDQICYWRKANSIHNWFDVNLGDIENCRYYPVSEELLVDLLDDCKTVYNARKQDNFVDIAETYLPTAQGFFFGTYDYDKYYLYDIKNTIEMLEDLLDNYDSYDNPCYYAWW